MINIGDYCNLFGVWTLHYKDELEDNFLDPPWSQDLEYTGQWAGFFWKMTFSFCENVILIHLALLRSPFSQLTWLTKRREVFVRKSEQTRKRQSRRQWKQWARLKPELEVQLSSEKMTSLKPAYFPSGEMTAFTGRSWALFPTENEGASRVKNWPCTYYPVWRWSFWSQLTKFSFGFCCCFNV